MTDEQRDRAWQSLPEDFKREVLNMRKGIIGQPYGLSFAANQVRLNVLNKLFGRNNLTAVEQPKPRFSKGDKVKALNGFCKGKIGEIVGYDEEDGLWKVQFPLPDYFICYDEDGLEPYTAPSEEEEAKEAKESERTFQYDENWKGLDLCELLRGCEGMEFYSPCYGVVEVVEADPVTIVVKDGKGKKHTFRSDGRHKSSHGGELMLYPSAEVRTWEGWQKEQKEYVLQVCYSPLMPNDIATQALQTVMANLHFRTASDRDKCIGEIKSVIEKYSE